MAAYSNVGFKPIALFIGMVLKNNLELNKN